MKLPQITLEWMLREGACWGEDRLQRTFFDEQTSYTPQEFLAKCYELKINYYIHGLWILLRTIQYMFVWDRLSSLWGFGARSAMSMDFTLTCRDKDPANEEGGYMYAMLVLDMFENADSGLAEELRVTA